MSVMLIGILNSGIGLSGVRALPLAAGINEGGHYSRYYWSEQSVLFLLLLPQKGLS